MANTEICKAIALGIVENQNVINAKRVMKTKLFKKELKKHNYRLFLEIQALAMSKGTLASIAKSNAATEKLKLDLSSLREKCLRVYQHEIRCKATGKLLSYGEAKLIINSLDDDEIVRLFMKNGSIDADKLTNLVCKYATKSATVKARVKKWNACK